MKEKNSFIRQLIGEEIAKRIMRILENNSGQKMKKVCMDLARKFDRDKIVDKIEEAYLK